MDWHPFEYVTADSFENGKKAFTETMRFELLPDGGTRVHDLLKMHMPLPRFIRGIMLKYVMIHQHHFDEKIKDAAHMAEAEYLKTKSE